MLDSIRKLMGSNAPEKSTQRDIDKLNELAPLKADLPASDSDKQKTSSFLYRDPLLDRKQKIGGYQFSLSHQMQNRLLQQSKIIRKMFDESMLRNLAPLGIPDLLGDRIAFISMSPSSLKNPMLRALASKNTAVMITPDTPSQTDLSELRQNLQFLEQIGMRYGWRISRPSPELAEFLPRADYVEIDTTAFDGMSLKSMSFDLHAANTRQFLIASELQSYDDFNLCLQSGFNLFSGPFVTSRESWKPAKSDINRVTVFEALNLLRSGAEFDDVTHCMRKDPILTFKLLRYINSPGIGLQNKVNEIHQALMILGRDRFYRWLSLLLFDFKQPGYQENVLKEQALTRARFMESIAGHGNLTDSSDQMFITGLFSLLDVMIGQNLDEVLKQVSLSHQVMDALKGKAGAMLNALHLTIAIEQNNEDEISRLAEQCGLSDTKVAEIMLEAISWSEKIFAASAE